MASKNSILLLIATFLVVIAPAAFGQAASNRWEWMGGSNTLPSCSSPGECSAPGVYGAEGKFAAGNIPPGRQGAGSWKDSSGNFWLFGGQTWSATANKYGDLNDLWEFNPVSGQWAWMGGSSTTPACSNQEACGQTGTYGTLDSASTGNNPGARISPATWTTGNGHLWLFGGTGFDSVGNYGNLNDLWEFNPSTLEWTWEGGSSVIPNSLDSQGSVGIYGKLGTPSAANIPGGRSQASTWTDSSGNLWLFGGFGDDSLGNENWLNDMWRFNPASNEWTWMAGSSEIYLSKTIGVYGTLGVPCPTNNPGAREGATSWIDSSGNLWLFGGQGWDENFSGGGLNDLWVFDPSTSEWAWMGGSSTVSSVTYFDSAVIGTLGTFAPGNTPSGRSDAIGWTDKKGNFWLFGGSPFGTGYEVTGYQNDTWEFDPSINEWAWMGLSIPACVTCTTPGVYGVLGTSSAANTPGGRILEASWTDSGGHLWLFGGEGFDSAANFGYLNDIWEYVPSSGSPATTTPSVSAAASPSSITTAQALAVAISVSGGNGSPVPTGSVTLTGGGYTSAAAPLNSGSTTINIPANSLLAAADTLTVYYKPDGASSSTYNSASGSTTVNVASSSPASTPTVFVSPFEYGIFTTQALPVTVYVYGANNQIPTGSVALSGGSYTSAATILGSGLDSEGEAHFEIPGGSLPAGTDTLTATYFPDANSTETFNSATGSTTLVVSVEPANGFDWTWMGGDNIIPGINNQYGVYGIVGVPSPDNYPGGRTMETSWTDSSGNFWMFGGRGNGATYHGALLNDLWKYSPSTNEWTWVSGSGSNLVAYGGGEDAPAVYGTLGTFAAGNVPGGREGPSSWIDSGGHLWLFGGYGIDSKTVGGQLNDLWEFDPSTAEWAWISGSSTVISQQNGQGGVYGTLGKSAPGNVPAARQNASTWIDKSGNLWLFGGYPQDSAPDFGGCDFSDLNDMWMFSPATKQWTWMNGSAPTFTGECADFGPAPPAGVYGKLGTPAAGNTPGGRDSAAGWTDSNGNFWLFGGDVLWDSSGQGTYNDLWEFNPTTNQWAWMGGSNTQKTYTHGSASSSVGQAGIYGTLGTPSANNIPGSREAAFSWNDNKGNFWLMGGSGLDSTGYPGELNDLWEFNPSTNEWTWMRGVSTLPGIFAYQGPPGIYGMLGVPESANTPGGRYSGASWTDKSGNLWLFGGESWDARNQNGWFNDLWEYRAANPTSASITPTVTVVPSSSNITTAQSLTVIVTVNGGSGNPTPNGSVILTSGGYSSISVTLNEDGSATISIPAGALAIGSDTLTVNFTPNADCACSANYNDATGSSTVTVTAAGLITPTVTVTPSPTSITTAQQLAVAVTVNGGSGNPTPTGAVTLTSGSYTSAAVTLKSGSASVDIPAGVLATAIDTLTVTYTPDSASASTYNSASGSNTVTVTAAAKTTPTVTVTPEKSSVTTKQALTVNVSVSGGNGNPIPTGSVTLTSGTYSSGALTLSSGSATLNIAAGSLIAGTDTLSVSYMPDSASSSTYNSATGSNTVIVTTPAKITPVVAVLPSPTSITSTQALKVAVTVSGGSGNPTPTGSVTLSSGTYTSAAATLVGGSATITIPAGSLANGTDTLSVTYTTDSASSSTYNSATGASTVTVTEATVQVTVGTSPAGLSFSVDGTSYTGTQTLTWTVGASHTIATASPQNSTGTQNTFASWSDGGAISHSVTAPVVTTSYTAAFTTSYQLTTSASPAADGTVTPASGSYYTSGTVVNLTATAKAGYAFVNWTGSVASASSASTSITMSSPESVTANFAKATAPIASLTSMLTFPDTNANVTSAAMVATLSNIGSAALNIGSIAIGGTNPTDFAITTGASACGTTLAADASCSIYVTFTPASATGYTATLTVTDNATPITQTTMLTGTGTTLPVLEASLTPATLAFTSESGTTTATQKAILSNSGNATLNISGITIAGTNPSDFAEATGANACGTTLAAGASCSIYVTFTPTSAASFTATLQVADNASGSPQSTTLNGTGTLPPTFTVTSISGAQTIQRGGTATYTIAVTAQNGTFSSAVALSASGLPAGATSTFAPPSVTPGSITATSTLSIQTATQSASARTNSAWPLAAPALATLSLLFMPGKRRRSWLTIAVLFIASLGAFTALIACGGGFGLDTRSNAQSYTVTVTGTSGQEQQSTTVQLTVQ